MYIYPAIFYKDENGYSVVFYDIELATMGDTLEEALIMAEEALTGRISLLLKDGETLPNPTAIEDIEKPKDAEFITLVKTDRKYLAQEKSVRKNLTIPAWLNIQAEKAGVNFSKTLQDALCEKLNLVI